MFGLNTRLDVSYLIACSHSYFETMLEKYISEKDYSLHERREAAFILIFLL